MRLDDGCENERCEGGVVEFRLHFSPYKQYIFLSFNQYFSKTECWSLHYM